MAETALDAVAFDAHQHVDFGATAAGAAGAAGELRADWEVRRAMMAEAGIACSVLMPSYDYDKRLGTESAARVAEGLVEYQSWTPGLFPWLGCTVEPQHYGAAVSQLDGLLSSGRFAVASWHNRYQGASVDAPVMFELVEVAAAHGCAVFVHGTANLDHEEAWRIARLVRAFPAVRFVVLDALMHHVSMSVLADLMGGADNVWLDTAGATSFIHMVRQLVRTVGAGRLLFGSDYYGEGRGGTASLMRRQLDLLALDEDAVRLVMRENLAALLGPPPGPG